MRGLGFMLLSAVLLAAGTVYTLKIGRRDRGLDTVARNTQQYWTADFRNVSRHSIDGRWWFCGEVSQHGAASYAHFVVISGGDVAVIQGRDSLEVLDYAWVRYCT